VTKTQRSVKEHRGWWGAILAVAASIILGGLAGVIPSLALYSDQAKTEVQIFTAGDLALILNTTYTWRLDTPSSSGYHSETITGGPSDANSIGGLWMTNNTTLHVYYTGKFTIVGPNLVAEFVVTPKTDVTAYSPGGNGTWSVEVKNSSGKTVTDITRLPHGDYSFIVTFSIQGEGFTHSPVIGGEAKDWTFSLAYPLVELTQVRS